MRKSFVFWVCLQIVLGSVLAGCQTTPEENPGVPPEKVQLHWFYSGGQAALAVIPEIVSAFNTSQDKVELVPEAVHPTVSGARLDEMVRSGALPDILGPLEGSEYIDFVESDLVIDVEDILEGQLDDITPTLLDMWRIGGKLIGVPVGIRTSVLYYNRDLFDAAGLSYPPHEYGEQYADGDTFSIEKMEEISMLLTLDNKDHDAFNQEFDPNRIVQYGFTWHWMSGRGLVNMFGADPVVDAGGKVSIPDCWREGYRWYYDGIWEKNFIPSGDYDTRASFNSGRMAMMVNNMWYLKNLKDAPFKWDLAAIPSYQGVTTVDWLGGAMFVSQSTSYPREAIETAYALATNIDLLKIGGYIPAFKSIQEDALEALAVEYPDVDFWSAVDSLNHLSVPPTTSPLPDAMDILFEAFRDRISTVPSLNLDDEINAFESELQTVLERGL
jgi:multiple sugar transport system substrate-binding protein